MDITAPIPRLLGDELKICDPGGSGLFMPLTYAEQDLDMTVRGVLYLIFLLWMFMGVNIVADYFMASVEVITTAEKRYKNKETGKTYTGLVWNDTCANLTLLALGSSAPEILLSIIEMLSNDFYAGALGPSTIVGSAAFNLMVILAVCILSIPSPDIRRISGVEVYHMTVIFSIFAYMWLLVMCTITSPDVIEPWEGILTLMMMPLLVVVSFAADKGMFPFLALEPKPKDEEEEHHKLVHHKNARASKMDHHIQHQMKNIEKLTAKMAFKSHPGQKRSSTLGGELHTQSLPAGDDGELLRGPDGIPFNCPAGVLTFVNDEVYVSVDSEDQKELLVHKITVLRRNGTLGDVECTYATCRQNACPGYDYIMTEGTLNFAPGVTKQDFEVSIIPKRKFEGTEWFQVILENITGGSFFNPNDDGGREKSVLTLILTNGRPDACRFQGPCDSCFFGLEHCFNIDRVRMGTVLWYEQIKASPFIERGENEDGTFEPLGCMDYVMHALTVPFAIVFALTSPPAVWGGGWVLFVAALSSIGVVTGCICDLADLFGCCLGIDKAVLAITVVALGTSLPDMFASKAAACNDPDADASIVNVTGSNSVNVFLGIGIPWAICAVYWTMVGPTEEWKSRYGEKFLADWPNGAFIVPSGSLGFSVTIFNAVALVALCVLRLRRLLVGGELGGPSTSKMLSGVLFILLWAIYIGASIWRSSSEDAEALAIPMIGLSVLVMAVVIGVEIGIRMGKITRAEPADAIEDTKLLGCSSPSSETDSHVPPQFGEAGQATAIGSHFLEDDFKDDDLIEVAPLQTAESPNSPSSAPNTEVGAPASGVAPKPKKKKDAANPQPVEEGKEASLRVPSNKTPVNGRTIGKASRASDNTANRVSKGDGVEPKKSSSDRPKKKKAPPPSEE